MPQRGVRRQQIVQHDLVINEPKGKLPYFLEQSIQQFKALLNRSFDALMVNREHYGGLDRHLQTTGEAQTQSFDLLFVI